MCFFPDRHNLSRVLLCNEKQCDLSHVSRESWYHVIHSPQAFEIYGEIDMAFAHNLHPAVQVTEVNCHPSSIFLLVHSAPPIHSQNENSTNKDISAPTACRHAKISPRSTKLSLEFDSSHRSTECISAVVDFSAASEQVFWNQVRDGDSAKRTVRCNLRVPHV